MRTAIQKKDMPETGFPIPAPSVEVLIPDLRRAVSERLAVALPQNSPYLLVVSGVPGAGKSSLLLPLSEKLAETSPEFLAFDRLMETIADYKSMADREAAFRAYEAPAREAGYALLRGLMAKRAHIVFEHSSALAEHVDLLSYAQALGYRVVMAHVTVPLAAAKLRVDERQARVGRHTPHSFVDARRAALDRLMPQYRRMIDVIDIVNADCPPEERHAFLYEQAALICQRLGVVTVG